MNKPKFKIGDKVKVLPNGEQLKNYHGGWVFAMKSYIEKEYTIKKVVEPGGINPFYGYCLDGTYWTFDERNLELVKSKTIEKKPKFKIGDKVRVLSNGKQLKNYRGGWSLNMNRCINKEFFIEKIIPPNETFHNCQYGYFLKGSIYTFDERNLELVKEKEENPANIIFKFKKNKIIAKREGGLKATASCHPDDTYDISFGMRLALARLLDKEKAAKEREIPLIEGFYICVRGNDCFSYGNIYKFENGKVKDNTGWTFGPYKEDQKINKTTSLYIGNALFKEIKWEYA